MPMQAFLANKLLDVVLNATAVSISGFHIGLFVSGTEVSGNNYSRLSVTRNTTNFPAASAGAATNGVTLTFATPSGTWGTVDSIRIFDASTAGNELMRANLTTAKTINSGDPVTFPAGDLDFTLA